MTRNVELLWFADCPNHATARRMLEEVIADLVPGTPIRDLDATDPLTAERLRFPGSPTIRVDGRDIDPAGASARPALNCRIYHLPDGRVSPVPTRQQLEEALR